MRGERGVLEGLPLTLIISVIIIVIGTAILFGIAFYAQGNHLSKLEVIEGNTPANGIIVQWPTATQFEITALTQSGTDLNGVIINIYGCGIDMQGTTASQGTLIILLPPPVLANHSLDGVLNFKGTYSPPATIGSAQLETASVSEVIVGSS